LCLYQCNNPPDFCRLDDIPCLYHYIYSFKVFQIACVCVHYGMEFSHVENNHSKMNLCFTAQYNINKHRWVRRFVTVFRKPHHRILYQVIWSLSVTALVWLLSVLGNVNSPTGYVLFEVIISSMYSNRNFACVSHFYAATYPLSSHFILLESLQPFLTKSINCAPSYYACFFILFRHIDWAEMLGCLQHMLSESFDLCSLGRETEFQTPVIIVWSEMRRPMFINP